MFNPFVWYQQYKLERLRLQLEAQNKPYDTLAAVVDKLSTAQQEQTKVLQEWMQGFKVTEVPTSSVMRDIDEWRLEQDRERGDGLDAGLRESIHNAMKANAFPQLNDILQ